MKKQEESVMYQVTQHFSYRDYAPQIWLMACRVAAFVWCYAYHDFQSWVLLAWLMHSTIFKSTRWFFRVTVTYYLPFFVVTFLFYYFINIPRVVEFERFASSLDLWLSYGFFNLAIPPLEIALMMLGLLPFFLLIKSRESLKFNKEEQKAKFLEVLTRPKSPTAFYLLFLLITHLDMLVFLAIFLSGVNKIDFYHVFLMFFFVFYIISP